MAIPNQSFDEILEDILQDYENQQPGIDRSLGSLIYMDASVLASAKWGIHERIRREARERFPDTATRAGMEKWATSRNVALIVGESDDSLLNRILSDLQNPPAGGNQYDWPRWVKESFVTRTQNTSSGSTQWVELVKSVTALQNKRGYGSVSLVVTANHDGAPPWEPNIGYAIGDIVNHDGIAYVATEAGTSSGTSPITDAVDWDQAAEIPSDELVSAITTHIEQRRTWGLWDYLIIKPKPFFYGNTFGLYGSGLDYNKIKSQLMAFLRSVPIGRTLYEAQTISICVENGAEDVVLEYGGDFVLQNGPLVYERVWPTSIEVVGSE